MTIELILKELEGFAEVLGRDVQRVLGDALVHIDEARGALEGVDDRNAAHAVRCAIYARDAISGATYGSLHSCIVGADALRRQLMS